MLIIKNGEIGTAFGFILICHNSMCTMKYSLVYKAANQSYDSQLNQRVPKGPIWALSYKP